MTKLRTAPGKVRAFGLVRDRHGRPKVDDPESLPEAVRQQLSDEDLAHLGLPPRQAMSPED